MVKRTIAIFVLLALIISICSCKSEQKAENPYSERIYATDAEKREWRDAIVKLISNQKYDYGDWDEQEMPRPNDPCIEYGYSMGLFDINMDGIPELLLDLGGGSLGNYYFYAYDIMTGEHIAQIDGGVNGEWSFYYDMENETYRPIGIYTWRDGSLGCMNFVTTIAFDEEDKCYVEKCLFYSEYSYYYILDYDYDSMEPHPASVKFLIEGKPHASQNYYYYMVKFFQKHSLVPHTGLKLYQWDDVSDEEDDDWERAEKMAEKLLFDSEQKFIKIK